MDQQAKHGSKNEVCVKTTFTGHWKVTILNLDCCLVMVTLCLEWTKPYHGTATPRSKNGEYTSHLSHLLPDDYATRNPSYSQLVQRDDCFVTSACLKS